MAANLGWEDPELNRIAERVHLVELGKTAECWHSQQVENASQIQLIEITG